VTGEGSPRLVVTIDGPAGSGKSTTARELARRLNLRHLDSGALYRALTAAVQRAGIPISHWDALDREELLPLDVELSPRAHGFDVLVDGTDVSEELRAPETTRLAPHLARNPRVREKLGTLQRSALSFGGLVADGRDMGTVVFPDADLKVFLTASLEERARRRLLQDGAPVDDGSLPAEAERIRRRDESDTERAVAPLRRPEGALDLDTTRLSFEEQVSRIVEAVSALTGEAAEK
jgi:cytidylate kinase